MLLSNQRDQLRRLWCQSWQRYRQNQPLEPLEREIVAVILDHPEYHPLLEDSDRALTSDSSPIDGENPFLHLAMHLAIREQIATNRPQGIAALRQQLLARQQDPLAVEHLMMDELGHALWQAQRNAQPPNEAEYLAALQRLIHR
jgi:hypothetical protein